MNTSILFFIISFIASIIGAISGVGGGVIIKPVLEAFSGQTVEVISFLCAVTVLSMSTVSLLRKREHGVRLDVTHGSLLALGAAIGGLFGRIIFDLFSSRYGGPYLGAAQSSILCLIIIALLLYNLNRKRIATIHCRLISCLALGAGMGLLAAFLGIGGGPFNLVILSFFLSMEAKTAVLHSHMIIFASQAANLLWAVCAHSVPDFSASLLLCAAAGGVLGGVTGSKISYRINKNGVILVYNILLICVLAIAGFNLARYLM